MGVAFVLLVLTVAAAASDWIVSRAAKREGR
jgi:hypothetical protein